MNPERLLENNALPFAGVVTDDDAQGIECAVVVSRLAWVVDRSGRAEVAEPQRPIRIEAEYVHGVGSSVTYPSDLVTEKPGTDVMMIASAWPQGDDDLTSMDVHLRVVGQNQLLHKAVRVHGPRVFEKKVMRIAPSSAAKIGGPVPLIYELAEGGVDPQNDMAEGGRYDMNPVGIGHRLKDNRESLVGERAFQIEPLEGKGPAGFLPISRNWSPRRELYGTIDDAYFKTRAPIVPKDFDVRYNSDANPALWSAAPLRGDELIETTGAVPEGTWKFKLPLYEPRFDALLDGEWTRRPTKLDSILIDLADPHERIIELTWRCHVQLPKKSERLEKIRVTNEIDIPRRYYDDLLNPHPDGAESNTSAKAHRAEKAS